MKNEMITVTIPKVLLLDIATGGSSGKGVYENFTSTWARDTCRENGFTQDLKEAQAAKLQMLRDRMRNIAGPEVADRVNAALLVGTEILKRGTDSLQKAKQSS